MTGADEPLGERLREGSAGGPPDEESTSGTGRIVEGVVLAQLPSGLYQVEAGGSRLTAHVGGGPDRTFIRVLIGDRVIVELAPRDLTRGRIVRKT